ncbi:MAG: Rho termination factor N-terminal domain-containing protein [Thermoleophilaceae bacterium]
MSVLARHELDQSPLADLHAIAAELGIEGFRGLRKQQLVEAVIEAQGGEPETPTAGLGSPEEPAPSAEEAETTEEELAEAEETAAAEYDVDEVEAVAADEGEDEEEEDERPRRRREPRGRGRGRDRDRDRDRDRGRDDDHDREDDPDGDRGAEEVRSGVLDVLPNGSGFMRVEPFVHSREDVYVSPAQIRRCELRAGDELAGPVRPPRRSERYPSLVRVDTVNSSPAEPPEERPRFEDLTPVFASRRLPGPDRVSGAPFGRGSRVAVGGAPGAGATTLLRELVSALAGEGDLELTVMLAGVRPEEVTEWRRGTATTVAGGGFDRPAEELAQVAGMAVERAKRVVERGRDAAIVIDSLDALPPGVARKVFGAARASEEAGTLTIIASTGTAGELQRLATTRIVLEDGGSLAAASGTIQGEKLA